jgi:hypothetical protein
MADNNTTAGASPPATTAKPDNKVVVLPPKSLATLAADINREHREFVKAVGSAVLRAIAAGEALIEAKAALLAEKGRGHWLRWLRENCIVAESTAQLYMKLAWAKPQLEEAMRSKSLTVGELTVNEALRLIGGRREEDYEQPEPKIACGDDSNGENQKKIEDPLPVKLQKDVSDICKVLIDRLRELRQCAEPQAQQLAQWAIEQVQETGLV